MRSGPSRSTHGCDSRRCASGCGSASSHRAAAHPVKAMHRQVCAAGTACAGLGGRAGCRRDRCIAHRELGPMLGMRRRGGSSASSPSRARRRSTQRDFDRDRRRRRAEDPGCGPRAAPSRRSRSAIASTGAGKRHAREPLAQHAEQMRRRARRRAERERHHGLRACRAGADSARAPA